MRFKGEEGERGEEGEGGGGQGGREGGVTPFFDETPEAPAGNFTQFDFLPHGLGSLGFRELHWHSRFAHSGCVRCFLVLKSPPTGRKTSQTSPHRLERQQEQLPRTTSLFFVYPHVLPLAVLPKPPEPLVQISLSTAQSILGTLRNASGKPRPN